MAKTLRLIYFFLCILLFCEFIDEAQGSRLRCHHPPDYSCKKRYSHHHPHHHHNHHNHHHYHNDNSNESEGLPRTIKTRKRNDLYGVDAFRPTAPGNSPGVGHSIKT
ncbi:precursor of CEP11 [Raphanus sativus]|uniref:Precursor of CEP11 n=1 Tax=Raphanus sativus TaxID=3726 RepID=A0A6J0M6F8_RAPSA|nr:precursor of CEP11 [Raphanus sativus]